MKTIPTTTATDATIIATTMTKCGNKYSNDYYTVNNNNEKHNNDINNCGKYTNNNDKNDNNGNNMISSNSIGRGGMTI